jgi:hypothetical protein
MQSLKNVTRLPLSHVQHLTPFFCFFESTAGLKLDWYQLRGSKSCSPDRNIKFHPPVDMSKLCQGPRELQLSEHHMLGVYV